MVSANQQTDLHLIWQYRGGRYREDALVEKYLPMVRHIVRHHYAGFLDFDDLVQEGLIGLLGAISEYRPDRFDVKFSSFAYLCIQRKVFNAVKQYTGNKHRVLNQAASLHSYVHGDEGRMMLEFVASAEAEADPASVVEDRLIEERVRGVLASTSQRWSTPSHCFCRKGTRLERSSGNSVSLPSASIMHARG